MAFFSVLDSPNDPIFERVSPGILPENRESLALGVFPGHRSADFGQNSLRAQRCWSFYAFDSLAGLGKRFFTFFGSDPAIGITYGVRIEVALAVFFLIFYIFLKTQNALKAFLGGLISYIILFILGSFPSWLTFLFLRRKKASFGIEKFDIAGLFLSPVALFFLFRARYFERAQRENEFDLRFSMASFGYFLFLD